MKQPKRSGAASTTLTPDSNLPPVIVVFEKISSFGVKLEGTTAIPRMVTISAIHSTPTKPPSFGSVKWAKWDKYVTRLRALEAVGRARGKVMRQHYPDTFKAMEGPAKSPPSAAETLAKKFRSQAITYDYEVDVPAQKAYMEAVFRAYVVDWVRLNKPDNLSDIMGIKCLPLNMKFILELAKAYKAKSPFNRVDYELAANWVAKGYYKMTAAEYTRVINARLGTELTPEAMEFRRFKKLGLITMKKPGPAPNS